MADERPLRDQLGGAPDLRVRHAQQDGVCAESIGAAAEGPDHVIADLAQGGR
jgi:hypothetical protein